MKWIFFDVGSTLVDETEAYNHRAREMLAGSGITFEEFDAKRIELAKQGLDGNSAAIAYFQLKKTPWHCEDEVPFPDAADTLRYLRECGYQLGIIANQSPGTSERLETWGLGQYFDVIAASAEMGIAKPDLAIFEKALEMAGCRAEEAVMVGDRLDNDIFPAKAVGMKTAWLRKGLAVYQTSGAADYTIENLRDLKILFWSVCNMKLTREQVHKDLDALPVHYKTGDVDRLIRHYVKQRADVSALRPYILSEQQFHRIYYYVSLDQIRDADKRMAFIHENLLFSDWWHTDQIISYVADLDFDTAMRYAKDYIRSEDPFVRRWGYVLFISRLCKGHAWELLPLMHDDEHYYVQMAQAWLIAELAVHEPEAVWEWFPKNGLKYNINGKAIQKICDSFRIPDAWKEEFKKLRPELRKRR